MDQEQKAANLAEADQPVDVEDVSRETGGIEKSKKLVVVGKESFFSEEIIEYAVDMAERMSYEIVALNTAPLSCETFNQSASKDQICTDFQMLSEMNMEPFREAAKKRNVSFSHVVKFTESGEVLRELRKEIGEFEFVVSQEEQDAVTDSDIGDDRFQQGIFVYSIL
jgi:hypothetical protein